MQIEVGKKYRTAGGGKMSLDGISSAGQFTDVLLRNFYWDETGQAYSSEGLRRPKFDIVSAWEEPADARAESNRMPESAVIPKKRKGGGPRVWPHVLDEIQHHYNCAVHNDDSYPPGPCDCDCGSGRRKALSDFQGYAPLEDVLAEAAQQAAFGKGPWQPIESIYKHTGPVVLYFGNRIFRESSGEAGSFDKIRDIAERTDIGFCQDGDVYEVGTGHRVFEEWRPPESLPTHWMPLAPQASHE